MKLHSFLTFALIFTAAGMARAQFVINSATDLFVPSFRQDGTGANETYFGWGPGTFDGGANNELMESPAPTINPTAGATLDQNNTADILSASNNVFSSVSSNVDMTMNIPTNGTPGTGFTTIIIQGRGLAGSGVTNHVLFGQIAGVSADFVVSGNGASPIFTQWWAKYQIPGNLASYSVNITGAPGAGNTFPISMSGLIVDTSWSASVFAADTASVPEPASLSMLAGGAIWSLSRRGRRFEGVSGGEIA